MFSSSTALAAKVATGCSTVYFSCPAFRASMAFGAPSKPPTQTLDSLPACFSAAIAPTAIWSLPEMIALTPGCACRIDWVFCWPSVRSQLAVCCETFFQPEYCEITVL